jgi:hypothetical protein
MTSRETIAGVQAFLDSYRAAFEAYDADAAADHFLLPSFITSDAEPVALMPMATHADCRAGIAQVLALHRKLGVASGRVLGFLVIELSPRLATLDLHFEFCDAADAGLYDFRGLYTLVAQDGAWRIAAIAHNQIPRLLARLAERD